MDSISIQDFDVPPVGVSQESLLRAKANCQTEAIFQSVITKFDCDLDTAVTKLFAIYIRCHCQERASWVSASFSALHLNAFVSGWNWSEIFPWLHRDIVARVIFAASESALELCALGDDVWFTSDDIGTFWSNFTASPEQSIRLTTAEAIQSETHKEPTETTLTTGINGESNLKLFFH